MAAKKPAAKKPRKVSAAKLTIREKILERLSSGESLNAICKTKGFPAESRVRAWALDDSEGFAAKYARARAIGYERLAEEILAIADTPVVGIKTKTNEKGEVETTEGDMIEHRRLQVDARKWMLAKMLPKKYGDRTTLAGDPEAPLSILMEQIAANPNSRLTFNK